MTAPATDQAARYRVKLERFEGPLDLLLQLIEREELPVADVSLAAVTEQYLQYLDEQDDLPAEELADFLVVAARLLLLKSRLLLPSLFVADDDGDDQSLAQQLELYRRYLAASRHLLRFWRGGRPLYAREKLVLSEPVPFSPPASLTAATLQSLFVRVLEEVATYARPPAGLVKRTVSLQEKIRHLRTWFEAEAAVDFHQVLRRAENRTDIIVTFLALLELVKQRYVVVWQETHAAPIMVRRAGEAEVP
jgi:segregation and condensation protein A